MGVDIKFIRDNIKPKSDWQKFIERNAADFARYRGDMAKADRVIKHIEAEIDTLLGKED